MNYYAMTRALRSVQYVMFGSAVLYLHGLRFEVGDVDLFVSPTLYERLKLRGWEEQRPAAGDPPLLESPAAVTAGVGVPVHAFTEWTHRDPHVDAGQCFRLAEIVHGVLCAPLFVIRAHKAGALSISASWPPERQAYHAKHVADLEAIDRQLAA